MREEPQQDEVFGDLVVSQGLASRAHVEECLSAIQRVRESGGTPPKLGEMLRDKGYLSKAGELTLKPASVARPAAPDAQLPPEAADPANHFGKYIRTKRIGVGGMGEVWKAYDSELGRWVALKLLKTDDREELARFKREAQTAGKLNHPNIAAVYDVGESGGRPFIVMQLIHGPTLSAFPRDDRRAIVEIVRDVARAVHYAHEQGVIHRDLKPQNVMVETTPRRAYVMDFGLARQLRGGRGSSLTVSGMMIGTPSYMAPEQARGEVHAVDVRTDVYGLGATLYEALVRRPPFEDPNLYDLVIRVVTEEPKPPRRIDATIDEDLEKVVLKSMDKDPARRYPTAQALAEDLQRWLDGEPVEARAPSTLRRLVRRLRRHKAASIAGGVALAILLAGAVALGVQGMRHREREAGMQRLASMWQTIIQRKQDLRQLRASPEAVRRDLAVAIAAVDDYVRAWPDEPRGYYVKARGLSYLGDTAGAEREVRVALAKAPDFRPGWTLLGILLEERQVGAALSDVRRLKKEAEEAFRRGWTPESARADTERWGLGWSREDFVMATIVRVLGAPQDQTADMLRQALAEYRAEDFEHALGMVSGDAVKNIEHQTSALALAPGYVAALMERGRARLERGDASGAEEDLTKAIALNPNLAIAHSHRARARETLDRGDDAMADHDRAIALRPTEARLRYYRGGTHQARRDHERAIGDFDRAIELDREYEEAFVARAISKHALQRFDEAVADYSAALELVPGRATVWANRGAAHRARGDLAAAIADYTRALELKPDSVEVHFNRANARIEGGDLQGAIADYGRAAELRPGFSEAWAHRGNVHAMRAQRLEGGEARAALERAEADLKHALELAPPDWTYRVDVESRLNEVRRLLQR